MRLRKHLSSGQCLNLLGAVAALFTAGCAHVYDVKVDAMQNKEAERGHAYRIVAKDPARAESDPNYKKAVGLVRNALSGHGMYEAEKADDAEVEVTVEYGVGPAREVVQEQDPLYAGLDRPVLAPGSGRIMRDSHGNPVGILEPIGSDYRTLEVYEKRLTIVAREARPAGAPQDQPAKELWRVEVKVEDEKDSVDAVLPVMVGAAVDHIDTDSTSQKSERVSDKSEKVNFVKGES